MTHAFRLRMLAVTTVFLTALYASIPFHPAWAASTFDPQGQGGSDVVAPATSVDLTSDARGSNGWFRGPVTATFHVVPGTDPVAYTKYSLDGGASWTIALDPEPIVIAGDGDHELQFMSKDVNDVYEDVQVVHIRIDTVAPSPLIAFNPEFRGVTIDGTDNLSFVTVEALDTNIFRLTDEAGNTTDVQTVDARGGLSLGGTGFTSRTLRLSSIRVNGGDWVALPLNQLLVQYGTDASGNMQWVRQTLQVKDQLYTVAGYDAATRQTTFWDKFNRRDFLQTGVVDGLALPSVVVNGNSIELR